MVFNSLRDRLSSLWGSETGSDDVHAQAQSPSAAATDSSTATENAETHPADETLSYAEQIEYGVENRDISDEDQILRLLVKRGGRVDETTVLEETGWKEDHLSAVIEEMEADDQISAITVGRKHVICRRGFEPKGYRSHLNE